MLRRLPVLLALLILLVAIPAKVLRMLPMLVHQAASPSMLFGLPQLYEESLRLRQPPQQLSDTHSVATPARIQGTTALVTDHNTRWEPRRMTLTSEFQASTTTSTAHSDCSLLDTAAARLVNSWVREGSAAGLHGILYDNRDRGHSTLDRAQWPQLVFVRYSPEIRAANGDFGFRPWQRFNLPAFGNASTALVTPVFWRSNPRTMLSNPLHALLMLEHYLGNQLYCAPNTMTSILLTVMSILPTHPAGSFHKGRPVLTSHFSKPLHSHWPHFRCRRETTLQPRAC
ncbi:MAG UNVERIFIED_CONTAM: hypothetical protein LVR18_18705 [Planctomycetaceae bacterium]